MKTALLALFFIASFIGMQYGDREAAEDVNTDLFPYWQKADSTADRYTDTWCEIATGEPVNLNP